MQPVHAWVSCFSILAGKAACYDISPSAPDSPAQRRCLPFCCLRIFAGLGAPSAAAWPGLEHLPHWRDNAEGVRGGRPEQPRRPRLAEHLADFWCARAGCCCCCTCPCGEPSSSSLACMRRLPWTPRPFSAPS
jgi:hypothetical protein